jgi:hypothetical protein
MKGMRPYEFRSVTFLIKFLPPATGSRCVNIQKEKLHRAQEALIPYLGRCFSLFRDSGYEIICDMVVGGIYRNQARSPKLKWSFGINAPDETICRNGASR